VALAFLLVSASKASIGLWSPQSDLGDETEFPLASDEKLDTRKTCCILEPIPANPYGPTITQDNLQAEHVIGRNSVLTQHRAPALVATLPPGEQISTGAGSGGYHGPNSSAAAFTSPLGRPGERRRSE
jgi:hypothetical protein